MLLAAFLLPISMLAEEKTSPAYTWDDTGNGFQAINPSPTDINSDHTLTIPLSGADEVQLEFWYPRGIIKSIILALNIASKGDAEPSISFYNTSWEQSTEDVTITGTGDKTVTLTAPSASYPYPSNTISIISQKTPATITLKTIQFVYEALPAPTFSLPGGTYVGTQTTMMSADVSGTPFAELGSDKEDGVTIYYTTVKGNNPMTYKPGTEINIEEDVTFFAWTQCESFASDTVEVNYVINQPAAPTFSPTDGLYWSEQLVTISHDDDGSTVYYIDMMEPRSH